MGTNARIDTGTDVGTDMGTDTRSDVGTDRRTDMGTDVGTNTRLDTRTDVGTDTGTVVGPDTVPAAGETHERSAAGQEGRSLARGWLLPSDYAAGGLSARRGSLAASLRSCTQRQRLGTGLGGAHAAGHRTGSLGGTARTRVLMHLVPSEHSAGHSAES